MNFKSFFVFFYTFLSIICAITIPTLVSEKNYKSLIIFLVVLCFLLVISISLCILFCKMATGFDVCTHNIFLHYSASSETLQISDVDKILVSDYRYSVYLKSGKKYHITRLLGPFKLETHIDPRISNLSLEHHINVEMK